MNTDISSKEEPSQDIECLHSFKTDVPSSSHIISNTNKVLIDPTFPGTCYQSYQAEVEKLKQELKCAQDIANDRLFTVHELQEEVAQFQKTSEELSAENDELINDVQDIIGENNGLKLVLKSKIKENSSLRHENRSLIAERSALDEEFEMKQDELLDYDEVSELVEQVRLNMKCKLKEAIFQRELLQADVNKVKSERDEVYETMESIFREMKKRIHAKDKMIEMLKISNGNKCVSSEGAGRQKRVKKDQSETQTGVSSSIRLSQKLLAILTGEGSCREMTNNETEIQEENICLIATDQFLNDSRCLDKSSVSKNR